MPLKLDPGRIDRSLKTPVYVQLANELRQALMTGDLKPGDELPSEGELCRMAGVSRQPVRAALDVIFKEGRTVRKTGWPTKVAEPRRPRVMGPARYRDLLAGLRTGAPLPRESAFTVENGAKWSDYTESRWKFAEEAPTALDRELLGIDAQMIWRRRFVRNLWGRPYEIVASAIPLQMAQGTILMDPDADPVPEGTLGVLFQNGYDPHLARHTVDCRAPNTRERELLKLQSADMVYDLLEIFTTADGTVIQAARTIMPVSGTTLEFETDLSAA